MQETQSYQRFQHIVHTVFNTSGTNGPRGETGAFPPSSTAGLCAACEIALSAAFVTLIPPRFYIHTFPGSLRTLTISNSSISDHLSSQFSTSLTNGLRLLSQAKVGTHSAFGERSHTAAHTVKQGCFGRGWYHYPRSVPHVHKHPRAGYQNGKLCRFWALVEGNLEERREPSEQRCAYACRCSEASRPRWAALLCLQLGDVAVLSLCAQYFLNVRGEGGITTLGVLRILSKLPVPACQSG